MRLFRTVDGLEFDSFLKCIAAKKKSANDIDPIAILEFLTFGSVYGERTFFKGIEKKTTHQPYGMDENEGLTRLTYSNVNPLQESHPVKVGEAKHHIIDYFSNRKKWLRGKKVSIDLTGGFDSRLIAAILIHLDIPFEAVFSNASGSKTELRIVEKLAVETGISVKVIPSPAPFSVKEELVKLIKLGDGQWDPIGLRSLSNTQKWRKDHAFDLTLTGVGGELYKDFWWQQDFPFYQKHRPDFNRLLVMRMYPASIPDEWLGRYLKVKQSDYLQNFKTQLSSFTQSTNTQTYDMIYYHIRIKEQISVLSHASANYLPVWSPLLEPELLKIGYNLRRRDRFMNQFHREVISKCAPMISEIPTTDGGMTVSNQPINVISDLLRFIRFKAGRVLSNLRRNDDKTDKKNVLDNVILNEVTDSIQKLKDSQVLSEQAPTNPEMYPENLYGRFILLGYLIGLVKS